MSSQRSGFGDRIVKLIPAGNAGDAHGGAGARGLYENGISQLALGALGQSLTRGAPHFFGEKHIGGTADTAFAQDFFRHGFIHAERAGFGGASGEGNAGDLEDSLKRAVLALRARG